MSFIVCENCNSHYFATEKSCPHCNGKGFLSSLPAPKALGLLLGLGAVGCAGEEKDVDSSEPQLLDSATDTSTTVQPGHEPPYGVPDGDQDLDGYYEVDDCDDQDSYTFPGAAENEAQPDQCMTDRDGDGYGDDSVESPVVAGTDCDDSNSAIHPAAAETSGDGVDSNCNGNDDD